MLDNPEPLLHAKSASSRTIVNTCLSCGGHHAADQQPTEIPTGSWVRGIEKMAYMPEDNDISETVEKNI